MQAQVDTKILTNKFLFRKNKQLLNSENIKLKHNFIKNKNKQNRIANFEIILLYYFTTYIIITYHYRYYCQAFWSIHQS